MGWQKGLQRRDSVRHCVCHTRGSRQGEMQERAASWPQPAGMSGRNLGR